MVDPYTVQALFFPADESSIKVVSCNIENNGGEDMVDVNMAGRHNLIPNLMPWFGAGHARPAMTVFQVAANESSFIHHLDRNLVNSDVPAVYGQYCLYYTLPLSFREDETSKRPLTSTPAVGDIRNGNALLLRLDDRLGMGHKFQDIEDAAIAPIGKVVRRRLHDIKNLENVRIGCRPFSLETEMKVLRERVAQAAGSSVLERRSRARLPDVDDIQVHRATSEVAGHESHGDEDSDTEIEDDEELYTQAAKDVAKLKEDMGDYHQT